MRCVIFEVMSVYIPKYMLHHHLCWKIIWNCYTIVWRMTVAICHMLHQHHESMQSARWWWKGGYGLVGVPSGDRIHGLFVYFTCVDPIKISQMWVNISEKESYGLACFGRWWWLKKKRRCQAIIITCDCQQDWSYVRLCDGTCTCQIDGAKRMWTKNRWNQIDGTKMNQILASPI